MEIVIEQKLKCREGLEMTSNKRSTSADSLYGKYSISLDVQLTIFRIVVIASNNSSRLSMIWIIKTCS